MRLCAATFVCLIAGSLAFACSSSGSSNGSSSSPAQFAQPCAQSGCASGLTCAQAGLATGLCTTTCMQDSDCTTPFGASTFCGDGQCVQQCAPLQSMPCPSGAQCDESTGFCTPPLPQKNWSCTVSGGVCTCTAGASGGGAGASSCPSQFYSLSQYGCCELGGAQLDPATYDSCVCQLYSAIPMGETCYSLPIQLGQMYGNDVQTCPGGNRVTP